MLASGYPTHFRADMTTNSPLRRRGQSDGPVRQHPENLLASDHEGKHSLSTVSNGTQTPESSSPIDDMAGHHLTLPSRSGISNVTNVQAKPLPPTMTRRPSAPMMPPFMVSAPGKVIVYGEHAVVHGKVGTLNWRYYALTDTFRPQLRRPSPCDPTSTLPSSQSHGGR
jgi:mevalonate kinase